MARIKGQNLYFFRYKNPAGKGKLGVWDSAPLVIPLDITGKSLLAVNLHWIPAKHRYEFVNFLMQYFKQGKIGNQRLKRTRLYYNFVKRGKVKWALVAIRRYHISRISQLTEIKPEKWDGILKKRPYKAKYRYDSRLKDATRIFRKPAG